MSGARRLLHWVAGRDPEPQSWHASRRIFLALLGGVYLAAFASLGVQVRGLFGSRGIAPVVDWMPVVAERLGPDALLRVPSLLWLGASDAALQGICVAGALLALAPIGGIAPGPALALLWLFYLSLTVVGVPFMNYQWDALLLETGFLAIFLAPWELRLRPAGAKPVPRVPLWLLRWLLFRLMWLSGIVKIRSGDEAWRALEALHFHYWTQPLPTWSSWFAHHLPGAVHSASVVGTFAIELGAPLLVFAPRRLRLVACAAFAALQGLIAATGNYGFFNLLTLALCVLLVDDATWRAVAPARLRERLPRPDPAAARPFSRVGAVLAGLLAVIVVGVGAARLLRTAGASVPLRGALGVVTELASSLRIVNSYGLFAVMTTDRTEIVVEGSADGRRWEAYEFPWKPGPLDRAPAFAPLHMPRLDWQMWFAALKTCDRAQWFVPFLARLLEGSPDVLALLERNPFPDTPPRFVRSTRYRYVFTDPGEAGWWRRERLGPYCRTLTLRGGRPVVSAERAPAADRPEQPDPT